MRLLACALLVLAGCTAGDVDLTGKSCPCAAGWYCDTPSRTCLPGIEPGLDGGSPSDAGVPETDAGERVDATSGIDAGDRDAGPLDAGSSDSGPADAGIDDTRCDDIHAGAIFCDGFEEPGDFPRWTSRFMTSANIERSTTQTLLGIGSLYANTTSGGGACAARYVLGAPITSGDIYMRGFVYIPSTFTIDASFSLIQSGIDYSPWYHVSIGVSSSGGAHLFIEAEGGARNLIGAPVPRDTWFCVEAHVSISETAGVAELFLNGTLEGRVTAIDTSPNDGYQRLLAGLPYTEPDQASAEVYIDEIVFSTTRIGCD